MREWMRWSPPSRWLGSVCPATVTPLPALPFTATQNGTCPDGEAERVAGRPGCACHRWALSFWVLDSAALLGSRCCHRPGCDTL